MSLTATIVCCLTGSVLGMGLASGAGSSTGAMHWEQLSPMPNPLGLGGPYAGVSDGVLLVGGGANFPQGMPWTGGKKRWYETVYALAEPRSEWREVGRLIRPMGYGVSVTTPEGMICAGGSDLERHYRDVFLLRLRQGRIETKTLPSLPQPVANGCGALVGSVLYVAGGIAEPTATNALHTFYALDLAAAQPAWRELEPWPGPGRMLPVAAAADGAFYLISGTGLSGDAEGKPIRHYLTDVYRFRPGEGWKRLADVPRAAVAAPSPAPVIGQTQILVLSGDDGTKVNFQPLDKHPGFPREILAYDTSKNAWSAAGEVKATQVTVPTALWRGRFVIPNGEIRPGVRTREVWAFPADTVPASKR